MKNKGIINENRPYFYKINQNFSENLKSPYQKYEYIIENNDSINTILKKFNIDKEEVSFVIKELKEKKNYQISILDENFQYY